MKYLGINPINMYKRKLNKQREIPCSWIGRLNIVTMSVLSNLIYQFNAIPIKISQNYFMDIDSKT
jgi:hypothetical protein